MGGRCVSGGKSGNMSSWDDVSPRPQAGWLLETSMVYQGDFEIAQGISVFFPVSSATLAMEV